MGYEMRLNDETRQYELTYNDDYQFRDYYKKRVYPIINSFLEHDMTKEELMNRIVQLAAECFEDGYTQSKKEII